MAAALALGADGVSMGSRFLLTKESPMHPAVQELMLRSSERDTRIILRSIGDSTRVVLNAQAEKVLAMEREGGHDAEALLAEGGGTKWIAATERGDPQGGAFAAGLSIALVNELASAKDVVGRDRARGRGNDPRAPRRPDRMSKAQDKPVPVPIRDAATVIVCRKMNGRHHCAHGTTRIDGGVHAGQVRLSRRSGRSWRPRRASGKRHAADLPAADGRAIAPRPFRQPCRPPRSASSGRKPA